MDCYRVSFVWNFQACIGSVSNLLQQTLNAAEILSEILFVMVWILKLGDAMNNVGAAEIIGFDISVTGSPDRWNDDTLCWFSSRIHQPLNHVSDALRVVSRRTASESQTQIVAEGA